MQLTLLRNIVAGGKTVQPVRLRVSVCMYILRWPRRPIEIGQRALSLVLRFALSFALTFATFSRIAKKGTVVVEVAGAANAISRLHWAPMEELAILPSATRFLPAFANWLAVGEILAGTDLLSEHASPIRGWACTLTSSIPFAW